MSERLEKGIQALRDKMDARIASYFSSCVHCGLCAEACLFATESQDPIYTPIYKLEPIRKVWSREYSFWGKLGAMIGVTDNVTEEDFANWETLVYDSCTMCGRCSMVCPVGIDITYMIRKEREAFVAAGYTPEGLQAATERAINIGSPMGVTLKTLQATIRSVEKETGLTIPMDVAGADYMALFSSMEIVNFEEYIAGLARIFKAAGVSWTVSSKGFEATNSGIQIGDPEAAKTIVERVVSAAEELGVKSVISPECGHAFMAIRWEGPNLIGRQYPFKVIHILELLSELHENGSLQLEGMTDTPLTYHDPCQISRRGGVIQQPRDLLNSVASNFQEMSDGGDMNWCCGGGGGVSANERADEIRLQAFNIKKKQLAELDGVETIVTACANCRLMLEDGLEHYELSHEVTGLTELIAEHIKQ
ncbi:heterodisulfide reductase [Solemya velum gill symbiont]|uniref:(Fe-S)-binding protein n=1 Tax=Solemya velum gill symbiont TaxID=2340 RepID=UPI000997D987|nr:(Fe-S)-binding protein [Solemya velum gill symbiont]OOZ15606.1 heterodisulfide reductase [Solemya velum gill symbiont]OOZ20419.1 heterodisulfide reductase [Solemya velum gill symbiont]OOZ22291.1 heterodisulfide reductase [Solemya velum gill symbiont]OOZ24570.1 heterodisulfide reductase [Solemya velum gill symbiont]OOZ30063.1 heterodisulfide reductase [Solemya velum gill symbiont]